MPAYIMTRAEYEARTKPGGRDHWVEPKSEKRLGFALTALGALNWATNPDARVRNEPAPDPNERLIVNVQEQGGKQTVREIYSGTLQSDGSILVDTVKDTSFHFSRTDKPGMAVHPGHENADAILAKLQERRKKIEYPQIPDSGREGYSTGGPYDPTPKLQSDLPKGTPMGKPVSNIR